MNEQKELLEKINNKIGYLESDIEYSRSEIRMFEAQLEKLEELKEEIENNPSFIPPERYRKTQIKALKEIGLEHLVEKEEIEASKFEELIG